MTAAARGGQRCQIPWNWSRRLLCELPDMGVRTHTWVRCESRKCWFWTWKWFPSPAITRSGCLYRAWWLKQQKSLFFLLPGAENPRLRSRQGWFLRRLLWLYFRPIFFFLFNLWIKISYDFKLMIAKVGMLWFFVCLFVLSVWHKLESSGGSWNPNWENVSIKLACRQSRKHCL